MVDIKKISSLTPEEIKAVVPLNDIVKEAEEANKIIFETYLFKAKQHDLTVYSDGSNTETFSHNGIWKANYNHHEYTVTCTKEGIYEIFLAEYLVSKKYVKEMENELLTEFGEKNETAGYFRDFLTRTMEKK